jgi:tetratricopeptide (TPR) repeat protein
VKARCYGIHSMKMLVAKFSAGVLLLMLAPGLSNAQSGQGPGTPTPGSTADGSRNYVGTFGQIMVYLRTEDGAPLSNHATPIVRLTSTVSNTPMTNTPFPTGDGWLFTGIAAGNDYEVHVQAVGYQPGRETVTLPNTSGAGASVIVFMRPVDQELVFHPPTGDFVLAPKAQKEIEHALQDLQAGNFTSAHKHGEKAEQLAPGNPYVQYVLGMTYLLAKQWDRAKPYLERSVSIDSRQPTSLLALGTLRYQQGDDDGAVQVLTKAVQLDGTSWKAEWYLACSYLQKKKYAEARDHAEQALKIGKGKAAPIELVLGEAYAGLGQRADAADEFDKFIKDNPKDVNVEKATEWAALMRKPQAINQQASLEAVSLPDAADSRAAVPAPPAVEVPPRADWAPPDIDKVNPFVIEGATCPLAKVLDAAGKNAEDLVANLQEFSATEEYEAVEIKRDGQLERPAGRSYNYMVFIDKTSPLAFQVQELRDQGVSPAEIPGRLVDTGVPVLALAFHPMIQDDLEWKCEGLGKWNERPAWVIHFQQRSDRPSVLSVFITPSRQYPLDLKGRAWVSENGGQVLHLETDLVKEIDPIDLKRQHYVIDYDLVSFTSHNMNLWLPVSVDSYLQYQGHFLHHYHHFKDFKLFWVGSTQKISRPKDAPPEDTPPQE